MARVFLLSPAKAAGARAQLLVRPAAAFDLAVRLQGGRATIGEVFAFMSGLYFRGKLAYARAFGDPPSGLVGGLVVTPCRGLWPVDAPVTIGDLRAFAGVDIADGGERYRAPLRRDLRQLASLGDAATEFVLLGSIATGKYVDVLTEVLGERLLFPSDFVGRGDMSRGGLMLRSVDSRVELAYSTVVGAIRHGTRPPKLAPRRRPS